MNAALSDPIDNAADDRLKAADGAVTTEDFYAYMPTHQFIFTPTRELWPASSVNARCAPAVDAYGRPALKSVMRQARDGNLSFEDVPVSPSEFIDKHRPVDQMTWAPGSPLIIQNSLVAGGGWIERDGVACFNLYRPPLRIPGRSELATPWIDHVRMVYPDDADHIIQFLAHRVQHPADKINHALVIGGSPGIGKDTIFEPVRQAVGPWNFVDISPAALLGRFNGFVKSIVLRISEARDLGDVDRYAFYEHLKVYTAAPPDVLHCDEKHLREHAVLNVCGVIVTTNHKTDGVYLPADDRRHYVAWSPRCKDEFSEGYWTKLYAWFQAGGTGHVSAHLAELDLTAFDSKAPPLKTAAFWDIVDANRAPEDAELADVIESLRTPQALTIADIAIYAQEDLREWIKDRRNGRMIPHRLESAGYTSVRNSDAKDGLWKFDGRRQVIYAQKTLTVRERVNAAMGLVKDRRR